MAQGTRVSGNLFHDNAGEDLFVEVDHGPFLVDNNLFLSRVNLLDMSEGGAYVHNLFVGRIISAPEPNRQTPYHPAHTTALAGLADIKGGDDRFYNNILVGQGEAAAKGTSSYGLRVYDQRPFPLFTGGNVYYDGALPYAGETNCVMQTASSPKIQLVEHGTETLLQMDFGPELKRAATRLVTTALLGKAKTPGLSYEHADGSPLQITVDYFGKQRSRTNPTPGPFENPGAGPITLRISPANR